MSVQHAFSNKSISTCEECKASGMGSGCVMEAFGFEVKLELRHLKVHAQNAAFGVALLSPASSPIPKHC